MEMGRGAGEGRVVVMDFAFRRESLRPRKSVRGGGGRERERRDEGGNNRLVIRKINAKVSKAGPENGARDFWNRRREWRAAVQILEPLGG